MASDTRHTALFASISTVVFSISIFLYKDAITKYFRRLRSSHELTTSDRSDSFGSTETDVVSSSESSAEHEDDSTFGRDGRLARETHETRQLESYRRTRAEPVKGLLDRIQAEIIGGDLDIETCFGTKRSVYCDWTASAKAIGFVEDYIRSKVLPFYANTHSMENRMGLQTSCFREEAREIIQLACNANRKKDVVVFCGSGATGAIQKLVSILGLGSDSPEHMKNRCVVFVGPYEHTSNLVTWRESRANVVVVPERKDGAGGVDLNILAKLLDKYSAAELKIGSFSACSNVTGTIENIDEVTALLHKKGALSFWDYASAGPYCDIDMNPVSTGDNRSFVQKDAVFISTHKFVGGVGGVGVLIAKRSLFNNRVPHGCGGGTVYFVDESSHRFLSDIVSREEGGTPNIIGCVRAGLAFKIKQSVGTETIRKRDEHILQKAYKAFAHVKDELVVLGPHGSSSVDAAKAKRLPTFSFLIKKNGRFLHHNFVVALLSDLYGIQSRGGCLCAGPYVQNLLGMPSASVEQLETSLVTAVHQREQYRPGVTRISLPYFMDDEHVDYVLGAICDVAKYGWRLLPLYRYENVAGEWGFKRLFQKFPQRIWLADFLDAPAGASEVSHRSLLHQTEEARGLLMNPPADALKVEGIRNDDSDWLRWYLLPSEAAAELNGEDVPLPRTPVIVQPDQYLNCLKTHLEECLNVNLQSTSSTKNGMDGVICQLRPSAAKRDTKQPKRAVAQDSGVRSEQELAFNDTVEKHLWQNAQMTQAELFPVVPGKIMKLVVQASKEWSMINPGDKLLLGLSGGKDSLCLLHCLLQIQKRAPFRFEIACCTIDPGAGDAFDPSPLIPYVQSLGIKYHFEKTEIFENARDSLPNAASYCSFCARMKRGTLYRVARENGYTALVLAQHLDDFVESFFMSAIRNGCLRTMKANYVENNGEVRVIRPLAYVREHDTKEFSYTAKLPVINENCPACFSAPTERERVKRFLKDQESLVPSFFESVRKAILPLMDGNMYSSLQQVEDRLKSSKDTNAATKDAKKYGQARGSRQKDNSIHKEISTADAVLEDVDTLL